jgi:hypothetical protein
MIVYTRDGSDPTASPTSLTAPSPATLVIDPMDTAGRDRAPCVVIRACATGNGALLTKVATHTYIFPDKMEQLSPDGLKPGPGWPDPNPGTQFTVQGMDYGMDPDVLHDPRYRDKIKDAMLSIPTFSIVTDLKNLFSPDSGIYVNALQDGIAWERPASLELIDPDGSPGFQIDAGLRMRGAWGRTGINLKHAFRLFFREKYGAAKLHFPLFGDEGVTEFDCVDLRTSQNYSWAFYNNFPEHYTELREVFSRDTQRDMGQPHTRSRYYHLYINGTYWGLYQTQERSEASFGESYLGGKKDDYDVVKVDVGDTLTQMNYRVVATDGNLDAYSHLWQAAVAGFSSDTNYYRVLGKNPDGSRNPDYPVLIDIDNLIDYMLCTIYVGDPDGPVANGIANNFYGMRDRNGDRGFVFFRHDAEHSLLNPAINLVNPTTVGQLLKDFNPRWLHQQLCAHPDYRLRLVDHIYKHFFNNGALTAQACRERILTRKAQIEDAVIAESARWGDAILPSTSRPRTKDDDWLPEVNQLLNQIITVRTDTVLSQLIARKYYSVCAPPAFSESSGIVAKGTQLAMTASCGSVYYTLDGNDTHEPLSLQDASQTLLLPRNGRKRIVIPATSASVTYTWKSDTVFNDSTWELCEASPGSIGYDLGTTYADLISFDVKSRMYNVNTSCLIRAVFDLTQQQINDFNYMKLRVQYSGGFVSYLNYFKNPKSPVASKNFGNASSITWNSAANSSHDGRLIETIDLSSYLSRLVAGRNLLAIQAMSTGIADSSFFFSAELIAGNTMKSSGPISPSAILYTGPVAVNQTSRIKARTYYDEQWSAPSEIFLRIAEGYGNLQLTELHYHPLPGEGIDAKHYEFIELKNTGTIPLDLSGCAFNQGISYAFPPGSIIQPKSYLVLASNAQAFESRYHFTPFGQYAGQLSNGGETITLAAGTGDPIINLTYGTTYPWPGSPDGSGYSLIRRPDRMYQDINDPSSWCASATINGNPGGDDNINSGENEEDTPTEFHLGQNFPNPFNPTTVIGYQLPVLSRISLAVYDILGRKVASLVDGIKPAGSYLTTWNASGMSSGVYFYRLSAGKISGSKSGDFTETRKLILIH